MRSAALFAGLAAAALAPLALSLTAQAAHAYVSNEDGGSVSVIDTVRGETVATVPVGKRPRGLKLSPDGTRLYVAVSGLPKCPPSVPDEECAKRPRDPDADGIAVVDTATRQRIAHFKAGSDPEQFDVSPDGTRLFISNEDQAALTVIDAHTGAPVATVKVGHEPEGVRVSPDGRWVLVTSETDSTISLLDARTLKILKTVHVGLRPRDLAYAAGGTIAYVAGEADSTLYRVTLPGGDTQELVQLPRTDRPMGVIHDAANKRLYVSTGRGGGVAIIDLADGPQLITEVKAGARPWGIALSPDGRQLYTANGPSDDVSVIDTTSHQVVRTIPAGKGPWGVVLGP